MSTRKTAAAARSDEIASLRIELLDSEPLVWREVEVPTSITFLELHDIIQTTIGWEDDHLWEFKVAKTRIGPSMEDWVDETSFEASEACLRNFLRPRKTHIEYLYDFGDSWQHGLTVTRIRQAEPGIAYPRYVGGQRRGPPEDCGGLYGFHDRLEALADPKHPDHEEMAEIYEGYDPAAVDEDGIRSALASMAKQLASAAASRARKRPREKKKPPSSDMDEKIKLLMRAFRG